MMKIRIIIGMLVAMGASLAACSQGISEKDVPSAVITSFKAKFPDAKKVDWSKESDTELEAEFRQDGKEMSANFDMNGEWKETEVKVDENELPENVKASLKKEYGDFNIEEAEISTTKGEGDVYEVMVEKGEKTEEVILSKDGKILKKDVKEEEEDEDDRN